MPVLALKKRVRLFRLAWWCCRWRIDRAERSDQRAGDHKARPALSAADFLSTDLAWHLKDGPTGQVGAQQCHRGLARHSRILRSDSGEPVVKVSARDGRGFNEKSGCRVRVVDWTYDVGVLTMLILGGESVSRRKGFAYPPRPLRSPAIYRTLVDRAVRTWLRA